MTTFRTRPGSARILKLSVADTARSDSMGSVYWAGLKTGDSYSMEAHNGSGLSNNNSSGVTQVRWGWGY